MDIIINKEPVLITGGCGFVGRNTAKRMISLQKDVVLVDDLSTGTLPENWLDTKYKKIKIIKDVFHYKGEQNIILIKDDIINIFRGSNEFWNKYFNKKSFFDYCFHFAAVVGGRAKIDGDPLAVARDLSIDAEYFKWAVQNKPKKNLYASSSAAYPVNLQEEKNATKLKEEDIKFGNILGQPDMTYGWSKLTGEYLARIAAHDYDLSVVCIRPFSGYGEDQEFVYPIPAIAKRTALKEDPLTVWGTGKQGRDFVHIQDCIDLMLLAVDNINDGSPINIGSEKLTNFLEVAQLFAKIAGYSPEIKPLVDKPVGVHSRYCSIEKARNLFEWEPKISLEEGFKRVYNNVCRKIA